ncbi:hypothetical protein BVG16_11260 [Paenibacillus selenitireducens]|uniref:DUF3397 domain-containing protein n=1 Tax=Paenibacillus selenitireducens TaxID=1324314 RepID=A0A1T2XF41_9BACL|nr:DUF3397 domain-containing protein [Paenibacillus selenitireducens]OPA78448.1 hypothetical protein BVG16_11260 [Paenibacillus selenitireducens]
MQNIIGYILQYLSALPFIPFLGIWLIYGFVSGDNKRAFRLAMDITTLFLILAVASMYNTIFGGSFGFYLILLILLIAGGLLAGAQNRKRGRIDPHKLVKTIWRLTFFVMVLFYLVFLIIGIIRYSIHNV